MGLIDHNLEFSAAQDLIADADSTNYLDMGVARNLGAGEQMYLQLAFGTVVSNATLATTLKGDDDAGGTNNVDVLVTPTITPVTGSKVAFPIRAHKPKRYFKCAFDLTGGSTPHIPVSASIVSGRELRDTTVIY